MREQTDVVVDQAHAAIDRTNEQLDRTDAITANMNEVSANVAELTEHVSALAGLGRALAAGPVGKASAVAYGVRHALDLRRPGSIPGVSAPAVPAQRSAAEIGSGAAAVAAGCRSRSARHRRGAPEPGGAAPLPAHRPARPLASVTRGEPALLCARRALPAGASRLRCHARSEHRRAAGQHGCRTASRHGCAAGQLAGGSQGGLGGARAGRAPSPRAGPGIAGKSLAAGRSDGRCGDPQTVLAAAPAPGWVFPATAG